MEAVMDKSKELSGSIARPRGNKLTSFWNWTITVNSNLSLPLVEDSLKVDF